MPGNVHLQTANPYLDLAESPFYLVRETQPWPAMKAADGRSLPRVAGVSSFGIGGANAHIVLEEYVAPQAESERACAAAPVAIVLSAKKPLVWRRLFKACPTTWRLRSLPNGRRAWLISLTLCKWGEKPWTNAWAWSLTPCRP